MPITSLGDVALDLRYAARTLARSPGFAAAAVLTLAIRLTGTIAMFSLVNGVLLSPLPVPAEYELFYGWRGLPQAGARQWPFTSKDLDLLRNESRLLAGVAGVGYHDPFSQEEHGEVALARIGSRRGCPTCRSPFLASLAESS